MTSVTPIQAQPADAAQQTPAAQPEAFNFHEHLVALLPRLRVQAVSMTRNRADADDLVQAAVSNALAAQHSFTPGTNFGAWMFRILRNRFLSDIRRRRDTCDMDSAPAEALARPAAQEDSLALRELRRRLADLPEDHRTALLLVTVQGMSYEEAAGVMKCAVGTAKCRVFRARRQLEAWLMGEKQAPRRAEKAADKKSGVSTKAQAVSGGTGRSNDSLRGSGRATEARALHPEM
ncbi:sigma-70 family RNA polymerase sigma factor [Roseomonas sp. 18066]|uniref:sigma-70 family RNA polymerase sigma factor n=1 Tax=Roseomonas sp. 18066 TaxID=2681412 RepID=UPI0021077D8F|nr:sigma-70 family RNA polymerase sigma factor [Roseomonas sp. 18066]